MTLADCQDLVEVVTELLEGTLGRAEERVVLDHLADCDGCATWVDQVRSTVAVLRALPAAPTPSPVVDRLVARMSAHRSR